MSEITESVLTLYKKHPRVAILMSGQGSNARTILGDEEIKSLYDISAIVSDNRYSNAAKITSAYDLELIENHVTKLNDIEERELYFSVLGKMLKKSGIQAAFYAGFMKVTPPLFAESFPGVNVHPADLSIKDMNGFARYRGMNAMQKMLAEKGHVRSTVHVIDNPVDCGSALSLSESYYPTPNESEDKIHAALKLKEHVIYGVTLKLLGRGLISLSQLPLTINDEGLVYEN